MIVFFVEGKEHVNLLLFCLYPEIFRDVPIPTFKTNGWWFPSPHLILYSYIVEGWFLRWIL